MRQAVKVISDATPSYSYRERHSIINKNLRPISHPYYGEYIDLQRLCLQILRHDELKYGQEENEIYGVLIDAAWLWEEYLADVLNSKFNHYVKDIGKRFYLFENNIQRIIPDYLSIDRTIVADAKYIPLDQKEEYEEEKATAIYYKTIAYMSRFCSNKGYLLYPHKDCSTSPYTEYLLQSETPTINRFIIKVGMRIPKMCQDYLAFVGRMSQEETTFKDLIL
jgi:5-methylcytosine-specific restriction endonuclease McrBC regulatory subunit McrC